ncbi:hypothetical protein CC1G_02095 [Coprinopsis cinerea okayama7|uniref:Uncharacterized protein n=1 Tax=Coprinopsis cinerea (strain Okayama-7 / 130 / ATCC MYA-4618 / FGSC 9003) TaxID=240176 RepID=A8NK61_COPC7|nr:hypothetical protein CC1G_02095 [Coprinopsis cinerea okayama7\|eukprot:XP_001834359.2 hypothetical protein CC1G_02095 [Coprinopsis cinerea okayama7\
MSSTSPSNQHSGSSAASGSDAMQRTSELAQRLSKDGADLAQRLSKDGSNLAQKVASNINDPVHNPIRTTQRTLEASRNIFAQRTDPSRSGSGHSSKAQRIVFIKGVFDLFLAASLVWMPGLLYDGPISGFVSAVTTLPKPNWEMDTGNAYGLASLILGAGMAGICAAESTSDDAYKVIATLNGVFAAAGLLGCIFSPHKFGSSFLLLAALQDVFWFFTIVNAGGYGVLETLGLSAKAVVNEEERLAKRDERAARKKGEIDENEGAPTGSEREGDFEGLNKGLEQDLREDKRRMDQDEHGVAFGTGDINNFNDYKKTNIN